MADDKRGLASADKETRERVASEGGKARAKDNNSSQSRGGQEDQESQSGNQSGRSSSSDRDQGNKNGGSQGGRK